MLLVAPFSNNELNLILHIKRFIIDFVHSSSLYKLFVLRKCHRIVVKDEQMSIEIDTKSGCPNMLT